MNQRLFEASCRLEDWIRHDALPLWQSVGIAEGSGAHYERLHANGLPDTMCDVRSRVQARQMFVFAFAHKLGWLTGADNQFKLLEQFVQRKVVHPDTGVGYVHLLDASFQIKDKRQDLYDHAFFILAYAWRYKAFGDWEALNKVEQLVAYLDKRLASTVGGWYEGDYDSDRRRQNPHMHLFEAFLHLYSITGESRWLARAGELFSLFQTRFYDTKNQVLREFFDGQWIPLAGERGEIVEPGHMLEWVWLLRWYERLSGRQVSSYANPLFQKAIEYGKSDSGLIYDAIDIYGNTIDGKKRCWPMTELIKACVSQARYGYREAEETAAQAIENLFDFYLSSSVTTGAYIDQRDEHDNISVDHTSVSTLYHLIVAAAEVKHYCEKCQFKKKGYHIDYDATGTQ